jgi:hypothetical protein
MSNGTDTLRFLDPVTFAARKTIAVHDGATRVSGLNELEFVKGLVCANVYLTDRVACADPGTGAIRYWIDLTGLLPAALVGLDAALNGIAYDARRNRLFVTGKRWPRLYEIRPVVAGGANRCSWSASVCPARSEVRDAREPAAARSDRGRGARAVAGGDRLPPARALRWR